jgi:hypothetical protein
MENTPRIYDALISILRHCRAGAQVLGIAFGESKCHNKLLAMGLPGVNMLEDNGDQLARQQECEKRTSVDRQLVFG